MAETTDLQSPAPASPIDLEHLSQDQAEKLREQILGIAESVVSKAVPRMVEEKLALLREKALENLGYTQEVAGLVQLLAARYNDSKDEVLRKALTLYGLVLEEREKGNHVAILDPDDVILHEVVGFEPKTASRPKAAV